MRLLSVALACFLLSPAVAAQTPANAFEIYSGCTNFTSRGALNQLGGEILMEIPAAHFAGVGTDPSGAGTRLLGLRHVTQDQNAATQETYSLVVRSSAGGRPNCTPTGLLLGVGPLTTPPVGMGWIITIWLATPSTVLPACATYYHGAQVSPAPTWPAEGQSFQISTYYLVNGTQGDNPAPNAPNLAWGCSAAGTPHQPPQPRTVRFDLMVDCAVLNVGNVDPTAGLVNCVSGLGGRSFGAGGLWPRCEGTAGPRNDGLDVRVRHFAHAGGSFVAFLGPEVCPGVALPGIGSGALYVSPLLTVASGVLGPIVGEGTATVLPPGSSVCSAALGGFVHFQAATVGAAMQLPVGLTNRASTRYLP